MDKLNDELSAEFDHFSDFFLFWHNISITFLIQIQMHCLFILMFHFVYQWTACAWCSSLIRMILVVIIYIFSILLSCFLQISKLYYTYNLLKQELLEDPAIVSAIDEETEFNALVVCFFQIWSITQEFIPQIFQI